MSDSTHKPTGGFAFPVPGTPGLDPCGMTLRDYFAAKAMQMKFEKSGQSMELESMAKICYQMADAMLEARK